MINSSTAISDEKKEAITKKLLETDEREAATIAKEQKKMDKRVAFDQDYVSFTFLCFAKKNIK